MKVMKFGGSSLGDSDKIIQVADIIRKSSESQGTAVVLSAMKGTTDSLIRCAQLAEGKDAACREYYDDIKRKHFDTLNSLMPGNASSRASADLDELFQELEDIIHGVELIGECSNHSLDLIVSFGERLSCTLFTHYLQSLGSSATMVDARGIIITEDEVEHSVLFSATYKKIREKISGMGDISVITGFIASSQSGLTTTLGRNGSDYTASLIGAGVKAAVIEIWTDVDGVLSADPRYVNDVFVIDALSYQEAMELSYFGAEVLHPYTMIPAFENNIPIRIKNTFYPAAEGTLITNKTKKKPRPITGIASIENIALLNVEGGGMIGIPGFAARIFGCLAKIGVNIIMISQASSEHSICLVFQENDVERAREALQEELTPELRAKRIQGFVAIKDLVIVAVIGENMRGTPGISGKLFSALGQESINVLAIAQGSSERNISFVISRESRQIALQCIHKAFL